MDFPKDKHVSVNKDHIKITIGLFIVIIIGLIALIGPAMTGMTINSQFDDMSLNASDIIKEHDKVSSDLLVTQTNLDSCSTLNEKYLNEVNQEKNKTYICQETIRKLESDMQNKEVECQFNISSLTSESDNLKDNLEIQVNKLTSQLDNLNYRYDEIIKNSAHNICCKLKIDDPSVDSFTITNNKIICGSGSSNRINC